MIRAYNILLSYFSPTLIMFIVLTAFVTTGGILTPRRLFTTLSLLGIMRRSVLRFFVRSMFMISEGKVALKRIKVN